MKTTTSTTDSAGFERRLALLRDAAARGWLAQGGRGIEKESLRVRPDGALAMTPHPAVLGAALTHPEVTTDYSEALLEFITPPVTDPVDAIRALRSLHRFVHRKIGDELLWDLSMPGALPADRDIPIADYGQSNQGRFKHVYRRGLAVRYGRAMQCIAGIHYNFSLPAALWPLLQENARVMSATSATSAAAMPGANADGGPAAAMRDETSVTLAMSAAADDVVSEGYMGLIRNYRRFSWLLLYLFGASPALDRSFFRDRDATTTAGDGKLGDSMLAPTSAAAFSHGLDSLGSDTLYLPYATSLRMSDLGYHNRASREMRKLDLSSLHAYLDSVAEAIKAPYAPYAAIGTHRDGDWIQLNTNLLQIENELYATIRPKRVGLPGERIWRTLKRSGIQYVEIRCLDLDPFEDVGIAEPTVRFLDAFLAMCVLDDSPIDAELQHEADANFLAVSKDGRRPGKTLTRAGKPIALQDWADELLGRIERAAQVLDDAGRTIDAATDGTARSQASHLAAVAAQRAKLADPDSLPSARVLAATRAAGSFAAFGLQQSRLHAARFVADPLPAEEEARLNALATTSHLKQREQEAADTTDFDTFVAQFGAVLDESSQA